MRTLLIACLFFFFVGSEAQAKLRFLNDIRDGEQVTVATMGTSLTDGPWSDWALWLRRWLKGEAPDAANVTFWNNGVGAASSDNANFNLSGLDRQLPQTLAQNPDVVFIEFGINDAYLPYAISLADSAANLNTMIDALETQNPSVEIIVQTMNNPVNVHLTNRPEIDAYYQVSRDVAAARGALLIDHYPEWLSLYNSDPTTWALYVPDGIHPGPRGRANLILPGIIAALESASVPEASTLSSAVCLIWCVAAGRWRSPRFRRRG